jgi:hypothetical protein
VWGPALIPATCSPIFLCVCSNRPVCKDLSPSQFMLLACPSAVAPGPLEVGAGHLHLCWGFQRQCWYFLIPETQSQDPCFLFPLVGSHSDSLMHVWFLVLEGGAGLAEALLVASVLSGQRPGWVTAGATSQSMCSGPQCHVLCQWPAPCVMQTSGISANTSFLLRVSPRWGTSR